MYLCMFLWLQVYSRGKQSYARTHILENMESQCRKVGNKPRKVPILRTFDHAGIATTSTFADVMMDPVMGRYDIYDTLSEYFVQNGLT